VALEQPQEVLVMQRELVQEQRQAEEQGRLV